MNEWKYFSRLISADPIDINQIEFYLLLANKPQNTMNQLMQQNEYRGSGLNEMNQIKLISPQVSSQKSITETNTNDKKGSMIKVINSPKR